MSELISGEALARIETVEKQVEGLAGELLIINTESLRHQQQLKILEENYRRHQDQLVNIHTDQELIKSSVANLLSRFDSFESKVFDLLRQMQVDSTSERKASQKEWLTFLKFVIGGTILLIVYKLFGNG